MNKLQDFFSRATTRSNKYLQEIQKEIKDKYKEISFLTDNINKESFIIIYDKEDCEISEDSIMDDLNVDYPIEEWLLKFKTKLENKIEELKPENIKFVYNEFTIIYNQCYENIILRLKFKIYQLPSVEVEWFESK